MANKQRAEVEVSGATGVHRFRLGTGAICQLEETLDLDVMSLFEKLQQGKVRLGMVREFVKASSVDHPDMSNEQANDLIDEVGVVPLLNAMTDSILLTFNIQQAKPKPNGKGNGAIAANPPKPARGRKAAGAGTSSTPPN